MISDQNVLNTRRGGGLQHSVTFLAKNLLGGKKQPKEDISALSRPQADFKYHPSREVQPPGVYPGMPFDPKIPPLHDINKWKGHF